VTAFGSALKNSHLYVQETTIFEHKIDAGGVITEQWWTGGWDGFCNTRVRIYIDGETTPSLDYRLYEGNNIGFCDDSVFQSNQIFGKTAHGGGVYNTYRIPFSKSIRITGTLDHEANNVFWFIVRGLDNVQSIIVGDVELPLGTRLRLFRNQNVTVQPYELTTLASVSGQGGMLFNVFIAAESADLNYLEACFRCYIDSDTDITYLSSGTEDFFLSAYYYNGGQFFTDQSGLTHFDTTEGKTKLSMYKMFWRDPLIFHKSFVLKWKNMEDASCPTKWGVNDFQLDKTAKKPQVAPMTYTSMAWVYTF